MANFKNTMGITHIKFDHAIKCYCTIGKTLCTYNVSVEIVPNKVIPDYLEIQNELDELNNHWYTMEAACEAVEAAVTKCCNDCYDMLRVSIHCYDARHFPVTVTKEVYQDEHTS